jgi:hypothetical protein
MHECHVIDDCRGDSPSHHLLGQRDPCAASAAGFTWPPISPKRS